MIASREPAIPYLGTPAALLIPESRCGSLDVDMARTAPASESVCRAA